MKILSSLVILMALQADTTTRIVLPSYPSNAFRGGNVVAVLEQKRNGTQIAFLHSEEPFAEPVRQALSQWRLWTGDRKLRDAIVIANFRDWFDVENSENGIKLNPGAHRIQCSPSKPGLPVPSLIVDPDYPELAMIVTASIAVRLKVSRTGTVTAAEILQGEEEFNGPVMEAVKKWKFSPARDEQNNPIESEAYAICVYRPIQTQN